MDNRKTVLIFIDWYLPGVNAGGPVRTCANMVARLRDQFRFRIVTRDMDFNSKEPYPGIEVDRWTTGPDGTEVYYFSAAHISTRNIAKLIREVKPDVIHVNSLFSLYFTMAPLWVVHTRKINCTLIIGPRGQLSKGALAIKPLKKMVFLSLARNMGLFTNVTWHASTAIEQKEITGIFGKHVRVITAIDLAPPGVVQPAKRVKRPGNLDLVFLGRISKVKNLLLCIEVLKQIRPSGTIRFDIYGPMEEPEYWDRCKTESTTFQSQIHVNYKGMLKNEEVASTLQQYHFLFLPTTNENYGHAIVESLSAGCPVIISDRTPWRGLEAKRAGFDLALEHPEAFTTALESAIAMDQAKFDAWSDAAAEYGRSITDDPGALASNIAMFNSRN